MCNNNDNNNELMGHSKIRLEIKQITDLALLTK